MKKDNLYLSLMLIVAFVAGASMLYGYSKCEDSGGNYVRGLFWMECLPS